SHRRQHLKVLTVLIARLPSGEPVIVAGDFNDWRQRADALLKDTVLHEVFVERFGSPAKSFPARWPLLRLERIYVLDAASHRPKVLSSRPW
ncbi:EEP domain-containing protein, partial [Pseudomonas syringae pv. tagetis]